MKILLTFWIGRQVHKTPILNENEVPLSWNGIVGTCDDYESGTLLEKKTTTCIPKTPNHVKQAEYYAVMLAKAGRPVKEAHIAYIDVANKDIKAFLVRMRPGEVAEKKMLERDEIGISKADVAINAFAGNGFPKEKLKDLWWNTKLHVYMNKKNAANVVLVAYRKALIEGLPGNKIEDMRWIRLKIPEIKQAKLDDYLEGDF